MNTTSQPALPPLPPPVRRPAYRTGRRQTATNIPKKKKHHVRPKKSQRKKVRRELSAGGVAVRRERGQWVAALLKTRHRRGEVWVLPKGHVELHRNEKIEEAAKREVQEEAGIAILDVKERLGSTQFMFQAETALVKKTVHYFLMVTEQAELKPQEEEGFIDAGWFPIAVAIKMLEYDTDQDIMKKSQAILEGKKPNMPGEVPRKSIRVYS